MALSDFNETFDSDLGNYATLSTNVTWDSIDGSPSPGSATWDVLIFTPPTPPPGSARLLSAGYLTTTVLPANTTVNYRYRIIGADQISDGNPLLLVQINTTGGDEIFMILFSDITATDTGWVQAPEIDLNAFTGEEITIVNFSSSGIGTASPPALPITVLIDSIFVAEGTPPVTDNFTPSTGGIPWSIKV